MYKFTGKTQKLYSKDKNGDSFIIENNKDENILLAIVSDGVGGRPCDWLASETTCTKFLLKFKQNINLPISSRITLSINQLNEFIKQSETECEGMCATMSLIVWQYELKKCFFVNIGDSRIYKYENSTLEQISVDDTEERSDKMNNALGMSSIRITVNEIEFTSGQSIILASDGLYDSLRFKKDIQVTCDDNEIDDSLNKLFIDYDFMARDDMTGVIIKNINVT